MKQLYEINKLGKVEMNSLKEGSGLDRAQVSRIGNCENKKERRVH